jgi:hypothetical protein
MARGAGRGVRAVVPVAGVRRFMTDLRQKRVLIPAARLTGAVAHAPEVRSASVALRDRRIDVDAVFAEGDRLQVGLFPASVRFAPRGAKEVVFQILPADRASDRRVADITAALAGALARDLYRIAVPDDGPLDTGGAIVERDGPDRLRVDLRSVPFVRRSSQSGALAALLDVLEVASLRVEPSGLRVELRLPGAFGDQRR